VENGVSELSAKRETRGIRLQELNRANRLYEIILSTTDDFAYVFDTEGRFLYANPRLLTVWAKTLDEVVGKNCYDLGYPTWHADMHMREIREIVRTKQPIRGEVSFTGDSGISGIYDYLFQPVMDEAGNVEVIVGTTRDVTKRKQDEEKLANALKAKSEGEQRYRFLADSIPQIAWTAKPDGNLDYYNQRWFDFAATTFEEMEKVGWTFFVHPDDLPNAGRVWQRSIETGCDYQVEFRLKRASDQTYRWHLVRAFPMKNEKGEILQWVGTCTDVDDQRQLSAKHSEVAAKFQALFEQSSIFTGIMTLDGTVIEANKLWLEGCGHRAGEILGRPFWDCGWWKDAGQIQERVRSGTRQVAAGGTYRETVPYFLADGTERMMELVLQPIRNAEGKIIFINPTGVDVTEQYRARNRAEFLARLTLKLSTVSDALELNRIATREIGQFLGAHRCYFFNAYPDVDHARTWPDWCREGSAQIEGIYTLAQYGAPEWWAAVRTGPVSVNDLRDNALTKDFLANYRALKIAAYCLCPFIHEGQWKACLSVTSDVPRVWTEDEKALLENAVARVWPLLERAQIEENLRRSEEALSRIAAVVESSDDAIISKSLDGIIMSWNAGAERIFGYTADEIIGQSILKLIPAELQKEEPGIIERLKKGERIDHYETVRLAKGGRAIDISLVVSPIKDSRGKVIGASKIARDITESVQAKRMLANSRQELERLVNERTASLQEAVSQMEEFSYSVSHDLRAPLRAMQGYATALLEDYGSKLDGQGREYLEHIASASHRMDRLTRDVLVYSKIPRTSFKPQPVAMEKLVSDIVEQNVPGETKHASITIESPLLPMLGNESFLAQSVSNLIDNAVKFASKERPLQVRIRSEKQGGQVRLWVEDNGIGILPEHQARVWGMFERIYPQHLYEGTGIGLAIVRKTIERMDGTVGLVSDGATGSKFWIQLPDVETPIKQTT
jgi:PAS domain S-box-containing protein